MCPLYATHPFLAGEVCVGGNSGTGVVGLFWERGGLLRAWIWADMSICLQMFQLSLLARSPASTRAWLAASAAQYGRGGARGQVLELPLSCQPLLQ
jgi:hypothetical protein